MSQRLTVAQLRTELKLRNLDTTGLKAALVARLDEAKKEEQDAEEQEKASGKGNQDDEQDDKRKSRKRAGNKEEEEDDDLPPPTPKKIRLSDVKKMTVAELREALGDRHLSTAGRKQELVDRLSAVLDKGGDLQDAEEEGDEDDATQTKTAVQKEEKGKQKEEAQLITACKKGRAVLDKYIPQHIQASCHVLEIGEDVYDAMLNQANIQNNNNKFYVLQILESDNRKDYYVWFRWGRVGEKGQHQLNPRSRSAAINDFEAKFREKTRNKWEERHHFVPKSGKYTLIEMDYEESSEPSPKEEKQKPAAARPTLPSKLDPQIQKFISLICNMDMMNQKMMEIGYDARKMPLGKLSKATISKGYDVLKRISAMLESRNTDALLELSNEFYTVIPHDFGRSNIRDKIIKDARMLKAKLEMVEALGEIELAAKVLANRDSDEEDPLFSQYKLLKCKLEPLDPRSEEFQLIEEYLKNTHGKTHSGYDLEIQQIFRAERQNEADRFNKFSQVPNRMLLWHGSRLTNWAGILSQGLRIAPPEAPSTGYMFGKGVYFADMVSKSANYCYTSSRDPTGVLLLCEVALGEMNELFHADYNADRLLNGKLSTKGVGRTAPDSSQFKALPDGVVVPSGKPTKSQAGHACSLEYNEYIVYNPDQIRMRYVLQVEFKYKYGGYY